MNAAFWLSGQWLQLTSQALPLSTEGCLAAWKRRDPRSGGMGKAGTGGQGDRKVAIASREGNGGFVVTCQGPKKMTGRGLNDDDIDGS